MKKTIFILIAGLFLASPVCAQQSASKLLVVIRDGVDNRIDFGFAIWHVVQLKRGGADVRVVFEGESVINFLGEAAVKKFNLELSTPAEPIVVSTIVATAGTGSAPMPGQGPTSRPRVEHKYQFGNKKATDSEQITSLLSDLKKEVPYTVCALSASLLNMSSELKAAGVPVSADATRPVDVSQYVKEGYQIVVW